MNTIHPYAVSTRVALALVCAAAWALTLQAAPTEPDSAQLSGKELQAAMLADREQAKKIAADNGVEWCQTHIVYEQRYGDRLGRVTACPPDGDCDLPGNRNASIPDPGDPELVVRLKFNVFRNDDGSNPAATQQDVDDQVVQLNSDFSPSRIMFEYETEFIDNSAYRDWTPAEEGGMKNTYADRPDEYLNIYVVNINAGFIGVGTFPWDDVALAPLGGIVMDDSFFGAFAKTLTHEVGHCLGLWHTHHGVDEVGTCGICYETPNSSEGDLTGDYCADTDPTPTNFNCGGPGGNDPCSGQPWGPTDPQNYMGYAPDGCYSEFSPQQMGRMHCWTNAVLSGWQSGVRFTADTTFGPAPLDVQFEAVTNKVVTLWDWDFGDGAGAATQSPAHQYATPGVNDVLVSIQSEQGEYAQLRREYIAAYADTVSAPDVFGAPGQSVKVDIVAVNAIPIQQIRIPFAWSGPLNLTFDSATTTGLRTEYFSIQGMASYNPFSKNGVYNLAANLNGGQPRLAPGAGPVLSLWFKIPGNASGANSIPLAAPGASAPTFQYAAYQYAPVLQSTATVSLCAKAGDADGSGQINIADVTYLIGFIFASGPAPTPSNAGDADCNGTTNIGDATFLIATIFSGGPAPCPCAP